MLTSALHRFTALLFLLSIATSAHAQDSCSPVRLDAKGAEMEHVSIRNQFGGTCFFEVATQLYDAYRFKNGADIHSNSAGFMSALLAAKSKGKHSLDNDGEGGYVCEAFDFLSKNGSMNLDLYSKTYSINNKSILEAISSINYQRSIYLEKINAALNKYDADKIIAQNSHIQIDQTQVALSAKTIELMKKSTHEDFMEKYGNAIFEQTVGMAVYYAKAFLTNSASEETEQFFSDLFLKYSGNEVAFIEKLLTILPFNQSMVNPPLSSSGKCNTKRYTALTSNDEVLKDLHHSLSKGTPTSVNLCSSVYEGGRAYRAGIRTVGTFLNQSECHQHAVVLMGRKRNPKTNRCQFLLRNSEGKVCSDKSKDWTCERNLGAIWIDADKVAEATGRIEFIR